MPRKNKKILNIAEITIEEALQIAASHEDDTISKKENDIAELSGQIAVAQQELSQRQKELETLKQRRDLKLGKAYDMKKENKQLVSVYLTSSTYKQCLLIKELYYDGLSGYIRHLIDEDIRDNWKAYKKLASKNA